MSLQPEGKDSYQIVRCNNLYWTFSLANDGIAFEHQLLCSIPQDPHKLNKWLIELRTTFSDRQCKLQTMLDIAASRNWFQETHLPAGFRWDPRLLSAPSLTADLARVHGGAFLLDLDREMLSIGHHVQFPLSTIPRDISPEQMLEREACERSNSLALEMCDDLGFWVPGEQTKWLHSYRDFHESVLTANTQFRACPESTKGIKWQALSILAFERFYAPTVSHLMELHRHWRFNDLIYKEVIYAVLNLAIGYVNLHPGRQATSPKLHDFFDRCTGAPSLPNFGSGFSLTAERVVAVPETNFYWFEETFISTVPESVLLQPDKTKAAISRAIYMSGISNKAFKLVLISCSEVLLAKIDRSLHGKIRVERSKVMSLCDWIISPHSTPRRQDLWRKDWLFSLQEKCSAFKGFVALMHFLHESRYAPGVGQHNYIEPTGHLFKRQRIIPINIGSTYRLEDILLDNESLQWLWEFRLTDLSTDQILLCRLADTRSDLGRLLDLEISIGNEDHYIRRMRHNLTLEVLYPDEWSTARELPPINTDFEVLNVRAISMSNLLPHWIDEKLKTLDVFGTKQIAVGERADWVISRCETSLLHEQFFTLLALRVRDEAFLMVGFRRSCDYGGPRMNREFVEKSIKKDLLAPGSVKYFIMFWGDDVEIFKITWTGPNHFDATMVYALKDSWGETITGPSIPYMNQIWTGLTAELSAKSQSPSEGEDLSGNDQGFSSSSTSELVDPIMDRVHWDGQVFVSTIKTPLKLLLEPPAASLRKA